MISLSLKREIPLVRILEKVTSFSWRRQDDGGRDVDKEKS